MNTLRYARNKDADGLIKLIDTCFREYPNCILDVDNEMTELKNIYSYFKKKNGYFWVIEKNKKKWGIDFWIKPDGPPFITLDINEKLKRLNMDDYQFRELTLRLGCPMLVNDGCLRIALTGFEKKQHINFR